MTRRSLPLTLALVILCAATIVSAQSPAPAPATVAFGKITRPKFKTFVSPIGNFEVQYPDSRDWTVLSALGDAVLTIVENKTGSAFAVVERVTLRGAFARDEMPALADREAGIVKQRNPTASGIRQQVVEADKRPAAVVEYGRAGVKGPERVVHYAVPIGETLYRVTCSVVETEYTRYAAICGHIAASVQPAATPVKK